ncbi:MAG: hypothetical protein WC180_04970 [Candidatus Paceibacterota bacterium]
MDVNFLDKNVEFLSDKVHQAWMQEKRSQGFHAPNECPLSDPSDDKRTNSGKFIRHCGKCHTDLYSYDELPENIKDYDRVMVRTVIQAMEKL